MVDRKPTKELIEDEIRTCLEGLKYVEQGEEQHARLVSDIQRLCSAYAELDKNEYAKADSDRKFAEEMRMKDLELHYRDALERDKMREQTKSNLRDACIKVAGFVVPTGLYFLFLALGLRLEFAEHGNIASFTVKELFKAVHPKPTIV